jgi:hypothetical protein
MFSSLQNILIITSTGKVLVSRITHPNIQEHFFGMLFSALNSFTEKIFKNQLQKIEMNNFCFDLMQKNNIIFIAISAKNENEKKIKKELEILCDTFFSKFSPEFLNSWNGALDVFSDFEDILNKNENGSFKDFITQKGRAFN